MTFSIDHGLTKIADRVSLPVRETRAEVPAIIWQRCSSTKGLSRRAVVAQFSEDPRTRDSGTLLTRHFSDNRFDKVDIAIFYFQMWLRL
jgi:hypothetical protein